MKNNIILLILLFINFKCLFSQEVKNEEWSITNVSNSIPNSKYSNIVVQDLRSNKNDFGFVEKGLMNINHVISPTSPIENQIQNVFSQFVKKSSGNKTLILQIRDLYFFETFVNTKEERGVFQFKAIAFEKDNEAYYLKKIIDDRVELSSSIDVTNELKKKASEKLILTLQNLIEDENFLYDTQLSINDVEYSENFIKNKYPFYNSKILKDGIYFTYKNFLEQNPNFEILELENNVSHVKNVFYINEKGKKKNANNCYAVIYKGRAYVNSGNVFLALTKKGDDYFAYGYISKIDSYANKIPDSILASYYSNFYKGFSAEAIPSMNTFFYEFRLDFQDGSFKAIKEIIFNKK